MAYTGKIKVTNHFRMPLFVTIIHRSGLLSNEMFISEQQIGSDMSFQFEQEFKSVQSVPVRDVFQIKGRWNRGDDSYLRAETIIKYSWSKADDGGVVEIVLNDVGVLFIPPSNPNGISQNYDHPIS